MTFIDPINIKMQRKLITITDEQKQFIDDSSLDISKWVQKKLNQEI